VFDFSQRLSSISNTRGTNTPSESNGEELEYARSVYSRLLAEERVQRIERNRARWPADTDLDDDFLNIEDMAFQVDAQNEKVEGHLTELNDLLSHGLLDHPLKKTDPNCSQDPQRITHSVEYALELMQLQLPSGFDQGVKVGYSTESRQIVVEYVLPTDTVVPKVKAYRWVKSRSKFKRHRGQQHK
jgi:restriction system protein